MGSKLKNPRLLCTGSQEAPVPPLSPRAYDGTIWRINEVTLIRKSSHRPNMLSQAYALLLAPYKRAKPLLSVVGVLVTFTTRCVSTRLLTFEFPNWIRSPDGQEFMATAEDEIMNLLDPNGYMRQIDLFGDGKTATQPHAPVGSRQWRSDQQQSCRKRRWMHQMYKLSPLMGTLSGSLMSQDTKAIITGVNPAHPGRARKRSDTLDNVSRTKRVGSMAAGVRASLPFSNCQQ
jgi:hypothetical protein